jgi:CubicO group peptidase (beta-lactamase class C family)
MKHITTCIALLSLLCALAPGAAAQLPADPAELDALLDPIFARVMAARDIPGAVCAVVGPDGFLYLRGHGVADLETGATMDPETTIVRVASLSKVFTAAAVVQQIEAGRLGLDDPVNRRLKTFQLPENPFGIAVTLRHLVTHTAGFDDRFLGMGAPTRDALEPLGDYLARRMPPVVYPPGQVASYSNHGMALAGHLVEVVTGQNFADYASEHLFAPLGMTHTTFDLPESEPADWAAGYMDLRGKRMRADLDYPCTVPASSLVSTAGDMARFLRALLEGGAPILSPEGLAVMQARQFAQHPGVPGHAVAWLERYDNGLRILEHGGLIWGFVSLLHLVPEKGVGIFVCQNTQGGGLTHAIAGAIHDAYFPAGPVPRPEVAPEDTSPYPGVYRHARHTQTSLEKFATIAAEFISEVRVDAGNQPGMLRLAWLDTLGNERFHWRAAHAGGGLYQRIADESHFSDRGYVAFGMEEDAQRANYLYIEDDAYIRLQWYEQRRVLLGAMSLSLGVALLNTLLAPINALRRKIKGHAPNAHARRIRTLAYATGLSQVSFAVGLGLFLWRIHPYAIGYGPPHALIAVLTLPLVTAALWLALLGLAAITWPRDGWTPGLRLHAALILVVTPVFLALLHYWNLLGYRFG